ncbi:FMN-binding protein [Simiduia sp. 21SJ11W-1]|uniref:FMN-binding protein n=1 Tax=Simiduia sp. 21SJ11W-1 TaxID=2909669 RepID=UPI00209E1F63|nr:FMN-binding protein [Simiduia sp. 21SJ11W-1]UTA49130.1 FMN-binding protein [Simiduia sp. 21SJ11W-1]
MLTTKRRLARRSVFWWLLLCSWALAAPAQAQRGVFLTVDEFLNQHFDGAPQSESFWLTPEQKTVAQDILQRRPGLRARYFREGARTAWILEEIGKELPITVGVVVEQGQVVNLAVLEYREVRGGEVRYQSFTSQFDGVRLRNEENQLDRHIDGISGATLSVRALQKIARLALYFHQQVGAAHADVTPSTCSEKHGDPSCGAGTSVSASG